MANNSAPYPLEVHTTATRTGNQIGVFVCGLMCVLALCLLVMWCNRTYKLYSNSIIAQICMHCYI